MVATTRLHPEGVKWVKQQEAKWADLVEQRTTSLNSLFKQHLEWFREHNSARSIVATRRLLTESDTAGNSTMKRPRRETSIEGFDCNDTCSAGEVNRVSPTLGISTEETSSIGNRQTKKRRKEDSQTEAVSRVELLQRFTEEEQKHGRYGLRNRSLGSWSANSKKATSTETSTQQRRKTIHSTGNAKINLKGSSSTGHDAFIEPSTVKRNNTTTTHTVQFMPLPQSTTKTTKPQHVPQHLLDQSENNSQHQKHIDDEQTDDQVQLLNSSSNKSQSLDGGEEKSYIDGNSSSLLGNDVSFFSRLFCFGRATASTHEHSAILYDTTSAKTGSPRPSLDSFSNIGHSPGRVSRLTSLSSTKSAAAIDKARSNVTLSLSSVPVVSELTAIDTPSTDRQQQQQSENQLEESQSPTMPTIPLSLKKSILSSSPSLSLASDTRNLRKRISSNQSKIPQLVRGMNSLPDERKRRISNSSDKQCTSKTIEQQLEMTKQQVPVMEEFASHTSEQRATASLPASLPSSSPSSSNPDAITAAGTDAGTSGVQFPSWATHPELDQLLQKQQSIDADKIFGKIPPLQISQIVNMGK